MGAKNDPVCATAQLEKEAEEEQEEKTNGLTA